MQWLKRLGRTAASGQTDRFAAPLQPDAPFIVIGDIHGRMDLLSQALDQVAARWPGDPIVFAGDYIDRGPGSAQVLRALFDLQSEASDKVECLMGNHEDMLLGFLDGTLHDHRIWMRNGGDATLRSFGIDPPGAGDRPEAIDLLRAQFRDTMGSDLLGWLRKLPLAWQSGNTWVTHAGADPMVDMDRQDRMALLWGHPDFRSLTRSDDQWLVHGHTIVPEVVVEDGRIAVDTGAYRTGHLSAVRISVGGVEVLN